MVLAKLQKTKAYFKTFQTKFRRRRESKTDYYARKRLVNQDLNKYGCPKYRLVVRITNKKIKCQIAYSTLQGDVVLCEANSTELIKYGLTAGLTNYATSYCVGLLLARRLLSSLKMDTIYKGVSETDGKHYDVSTLNNERRPFKAALDIGLKRSTVGARVFAAMKGACDGGLNIPHSVKNFPGYEKVGKKGEYNAEVHRDKIFGCDIDEYMGKLEEENKDKYKKQFSNWDKCLDTNKLETVEELYKKIHEQIRKNPARPAKKEAPKKHKTDTDKNVRIAPNGAKYLRSVKFTLAERKVRINNKLELIKKSKQQ